MNLDLYFERIGYRGTAAPNIETLRAIHRLHATKIAYENIDVVLGVPVDQDVGHIYTKIIERGRGGWCYEMNGLLGWALAEIGFKVTRMSGAVLRVAQGDEAFGNHLVLRIDLNGRDDEPYIADVGLGDGILECIPFREGDYEQDGRRFRLERLTEGEWRFHNREGAMPPSFDFRSAPKDEDELAATCAEIQADPESMLQQNLVIQRPSGTGANFLLGCMLTRPTGVRQILESEAEFVDVLTDVFGIRIPNIDGLWANVVKRHEVLFGGTSAEEISIEEPA